MSTDHLFLTPDSLNRLASAWAAQGAPIADQLADGLTDQEIDALMAPLGLRLPAEARMWWGWHDGVPWRPSGGVTPERALGHGLQYLPLRDAVDQYLKEREVFSEVTGDPEPYRPASLFPITWRAGPIMCDCSVPEGEPTPIYFSGSHDARPEDFERPAARSFGEMVTWWIEAIEDGVWRWDSGLEAWAIHPDLLDPERRTGLV
jgi:hypothetical protein